MENTTLDRRIDSSVLYFGLNGYGITWIYVIVHIFMALVALLGIFLNVFSLFVINRKEHGTDMSIIFISNLACSDFVYDIWGLYLVLYNMVHYKNYYECAFRFGLAIGICFNSLLQLLALTVDRFTKIIYPYQYVRIFKERSANIFCVLSWSFSGLFGLLPLLGVRKPMTHGTAYCSFFGVLDDFYLILVTTLFCLVFVMLIACYIRIWWASFTQSKHMYGPGRIRHLWLSPTKTIVILIVFYCLCWFPLGICVMLHLAGRFPANFTDAKKGTVLAYCSCLIFMDTIANPVVYALKIKTVKKRWRKLLGKFISKNKVVAVNPVKLSNVTYIEKFREENC